MENKINLVELLKDCPIGMELDCTIYEDVILNKIDNSPEREYPIQIVTRKGYLLDLTKYGTYIDIEEAKCVIFPKGETTWGGFVPPYKFKDGDVIYNQGIKATAIFYKQTSDNTISHCFLNMHNSLIIWHYHSKSLFDWRLATEEEKAKLFQSIKDNGYCWNTETKTLEKLIKPKFKVGDRIKHRLTGEVYIVLFVLSNSYGGGVYDVAVTNEIGKSIDVKEQDNYELVPNKFDITTLKTFDKVLVRQSVHGIWGIDFFGFYNYDEGYYYTTSNCAYTQCIPYEQNEHLLGTTNDCDEFYKAWE